MADAPARELRPRSGNRLPDAGPAHRRGLKVITELVINHTSDQHPWFQAARSAPRGSAARDFYLWSDSDKQLAGTRIIFTDTETLNWAWDPVAGQYYWHRFFSHQSDLNHDDPQLVEAVIRQMRAVVVAHYSGRMFLAETHQRPEDMREYLRDGDECHMAESLME